jgi:hypothetical protein
LTRTLARPYDSGREGSQITVRGRSRTKWSSAVVDLADARDDKQLREYQSRLRSVLDANRIALGRLFQSGVIFGRAGARLGRDLLLARQHLLKVMDLLGRLEDLDGSERGAEDPAAEALYAQVRSLLARTSELSARSEGLLAREQ